MRESLKSLESTSTRLSLGLLAIALSPPVLGQPVNMFGDVKTAAPEVVSDVLSGAFWQNNFVRANQNLADCGEKVDIAQGPRSAHPASVRLEAARRARQCVSLVKSELISQLPRDATPSTLMAFQNYERLLADSEEQSSSGMLTSKGFPSALASGYRLEGSTLNPERSGRTGSFGQLRR